jgi:hypothetical protein
VGFPRRNAHNFIRPSSNYLGKKVITNSEPNMPDMQNVTEILEKIIRAATDDVDLHASYIHYVLHNEVKVIYKDKEQQ